jgi:Septum formation
VYWGQLKTGDCFKGFTKRATTSATRVDCRSPGHQAEVTGRFKPSGGSRYPGDAAVEKASDDRCQRYFARYVGVDWDSSAYDYAYVTPDPRASVTGRSSASPSTRAIPRTARSPCATSRSNAY